MYTIKTGNPPEPRWSNNERWKQIRFALRRMKPGEHIELPRNSTDLKNVGRITAKVHKIIPTANVYRSKQDTIVILYPENDGKGVASPQSAPTQPSRPPRNKPTIPADLLPVARPAAPEMSPDRAKYHEHPVVGMAQEKAEAPMLPGKAVLIRGTNSNTWNQAKPVRVDLTLAADTAGQIRAPLPGVAPRRAD